MRNHTCLLDHHQRSHYDTITIGPEGMINWVLQLNIDQSGNSLNSHLEKQFILVLHEELISSDRSGKPDDLLENTRVKQTHDRSGKPDERNSSSAHKVREQFAPDENRDIASFNTDNEFNRAINEEDMDFKNSRTTTFCSETIT